jgi:hypothetical protein
MLRVSVPGCGRITESLSDKDLRYISPAPGLPAKRQGMVTRPITLNVNNRRFLTTNFSSGIERINSKYLSGVAGANI